jgi:hypothetical protein
VTLDRRDVVELVGYDGSGVEVFREAVSKYAYYEDLHRVVDEDSFRSERGIVRLVGKMYDDSGELEQEFECSYSLKGALSLAGARYSDGTITGDWHVLRPSAV